MKFVMLVAILSFVSCANKPPKVTINQIDAVNNLINPNKVDKYNDKTCKIEGHQLTPLSLLTGDGKVNSYMHGQFCISYNDFVDLQVWGKTECENAKRREEYIKALELQNQQMRSQLQQITK